MRLVIGTSDSKRFRGALKRLCRALNDVPAAGAGIQRFILQTCVDDKTDNASGQRRVWEFRDLEQLTDCIPHDRRL